MPKIFITGPIAENGLHILRQKGFSIEVNKSTNDLGDSELKKVFSEYDAIISMVNNTLDSEIIGRASANLKIISNYAVGVDNIDVSAAKQKGIIVTNTPGVANESVAEHVFALIFACSKSIIGADKFVREGKYQKWDPNLFLSHQTWGQTIGVIGLGRIGTFVGQIAYGGFRMKVMYFDVRRAEDFELICEARYGTVDEILKEADVVTLHVPLTDKTRHMIGREELKKMKNSAILINTSRGPVVEEEALVWALQKKEIAAAGLDVFEFEPKISKELLKLENVVVTPHVASATYETREAMSKIAAQNIVDVFEGKEPMGLVRS